MGFQNFLKLFTISARYVIIIFVRTKGIFMKLTNITKIGHGKYILNNIALVTIENGRVTVQYDNTKITNKEIEELVKQFFIDCKVSEVKEN